MYDNKQIIGAGCAVTVADREPEITAAYRRLADTASRLNDLSERLRERLVPVLRNEPPGLVSGGQKEPVVPEVPLAIKLRELDAMLMRAEDIFCDINRRIEV